MLIWTAEDAEAVAVKGGQTGPWVAFALVLSMALAGCPAHQPGAANDRPSHSIPTVGTRVPVVAAAPATSAPGTISTDEAALEGPPPDVWVAPPVHAAALPCTMSAQGTGGRFTVTAATSEHNATEETWEDTGLVVSQGDVSSTRTAADGWLIGGLTTTAGHAEVSTASARCAAAASSYVAAATLAPLDVLTLEQASSLATSSCGSAAANAVVVGLTILGVGIPGGSPAPNTRHTVGPVTVILNEQEAGPASISVTAVHVVLPDKDFRFATASAATGPCPPPGTPAPAEPRDPPSPCAMTARAWGLNSTVRLPVTGTVISTMTSQDTGLLATSGSHLVETTMGDLQSPGYAGTQWQGHLQTRGATLSKDCFVGARFTAAMATMPAAGGRPELVLRDVLVEVDLTCSYVRHRVEASYVEANGLPIPHDETVQVPVSIVDYVEKGPWKDGHKWASQNAYAAGETSLLHAEVGLSGCAPPAPPHERSPTNSTTSSHPHPTGSSSSSSTSHPSSTTTPPPSTTSSSTTKPPG